MRWTMKQYETFESTNTTIWRFSFAFTSKRNHVFDIRSLTFKLIKNISSSSNCTFEMYELLSRTSKFQDFEIFIFDIFVIVIVIIKICSFSIIEAIFFFFLNDSLWLSSNLCVDNSRHFSSFCLCHDFYRLYEHVNLEKHDLIHENSNIKKQNDSFDHNYNIFARKHS